MRGKDHEEEERRWIEGKGVECDEHKWTIMGEVQQE